METKILERIAEALEAIRDEQKKTNELLLSITFSKAGEEIRNSAGEINTRYLRGIRD